ncbi:hypothetical protein MBANPS3_009865 [Mucor bainieri]
MLSEYKELLEKRRLERKRGHKPPSLPDSIDYDSYFAPEPIRLSRRSPSVASRQSVVAPSPPPPPIARSRRIITPPPLAFSAVNAMESGQRTSPQRPSYLSQLPPFSVTPRKRLFAETSMIAIDESATDLNNKDAYRTRRTGYLSIARETERTEYPEQSRVETPAAVKQANIPAFQHVGHADDVDMLDANTQNMIPDTEQPVLPVVDENDMAERLSIHELSIHEESHQENEPHNTPPVTAQSPIANSDNEHPSILPLEPQQPVAKEIPQEQNESQQETVKDNSLNEPNALQQRTSGDGVGVTKEAHDETLGSAEPQEAVEQETGEKPAYRSEYQTFIEEETQDNSGKSHQAAGESTETAAAKVPDQTTLIDRAPETEGPVDPAAEGPVDPAAEDPVDPATEGNPIKYGFDDDNIDYGGYEDVDQEDERGGEPAAGSVSQTGNHTSEAEEEQDTSNDVLRELRAMATTNTVNMKRIKKLSSLHIQTISNLVLEKTKEARDNTTDAHEKSIIEDYYYTVNDDLKKRHKQYLQYQQCASANRRLKGYHRKTELQFLDAIKEEAALQRRIADLRQQIDELDTQEKTWTGIEDLFHDINQIKDTTTTSSSSSSSANVTKQVE